MERAPAALPADVEAILKASCVDLGAAGVDDTFGYGRLDLLSALRTPGDAPPVADFAAPAVEGRGPLTVAFRDLSTGVPTSWTWDFGDGASSSAQNPTHTFDALGSYTVSLTAHNRHGSDTATRVDYVLVDVIPPVADFDATPTGGLSPLTVQFSDLSTGGLPTTWLWDFGDGATSTQPSPSHVYTASGFYTVSLTVTNPYGSDQLVRTDLVAVDLVPPIAAFSASPTTGDSPYVVHFTDESVGGVATGWQWSFGDGYGSTAQHPDHTYTAEGTYSVRLTASNAYGADELLKLGYVVVGPGPPVLADFSATPTSGPAPLTVQFTDLSIGNVASWVWEFDDGSSSDLPSPVHTFTAPGEYNISLEVADPNGTNHQVEREAFIVVN